MSKVANDVGFTLIEIIATIVLFGLVAVMGVSFFSSGVTRTDIPVTQLQADAHLQLVLENMIADKENSYSANGTALKNFADALGSVNSSQSTYGSGRNYYLSEKRFVCPNVSNSFQNNGTAYQFLLVTIKDNVNSGSSLSYLFSSNNANVNCTSGGS